MEPGDEARGRRLHRRSGHEPGQAHALTFSCYGGQAFLSRDRSRGWMIESITEARAVHGFQLWAYVVMPEHAHILIRPAEGCSIAAILSSLKQPVARHAVDFVRESAPEFLPRMLDEQPNGRRSHRFWQRGGGYDRNLYEPRYVWETIAYIHANRVRRGLCIRPEDWRWSSVRAYLEPASYEGPTIGLASLPADPRP